MPFAKQSVKQTTVVPVLTVVCIVVFGEQWGETLKLVNSIQQTCSRHSTTVVLFDKNPNVVWRSCIAHGSPYAIYYEKGTNPAASTSIYSK